MFVTFLRTKNVNNESVCECNLMEEEIPGEIAHTDKGFDVDIKPFEIKTYRVILK